MKLFIYLLLFVCLITSVSAYSHCVDFQGEEWCCDNSGDVVCDPYNPSVCGQDDGWCDNFNNPELSCIPGEDWCCYDSGWVVDYSAHRCCPPEYPFYYAPTGNCYSYPYGTTSQPSTAENYYTRLSNCGWYEWRSEDQCRGLELYECSKVDTFISQLTPQGRVLNECGVECVDDSTCPADEILGNFCNVNQIMQTTKKYSCSDSTCISSENTEILETCSLACEEVETDYILHAFSISNPEFVPTCVGCTENDIILLDDVYYMCVSQELKPVLDLVEFTDEEQAALLEQIRLLNLSIEEQTAIVENLELTLSQKIELVNTLTNQISEQVLLIEAMQTTSAEQAAIILSLNLNIQEQADMINQLTSNLATKAYLVDQLQAENEQQAELIRLMELSFGDQAGIIQQLDNTIQEDAIIISNLNLNLAEQADLISELELSNQELQDLVVALNLNIEQQAELIANLRLSLTQERELVEELQETIEEQQRLLDLIQNTTPSTTTTFDIEEFFNDYKIPIMIGGAVVFLLLLSGGRRR